MKYKEIEMRFRVQKSRWSDIFFQYTFIFSLVLAAAVLVLYIPYYQNKHELLSLEYKSEILNQELDELRNAIEANALSDQDLRYQELTIFLSDLKQQEDLIHLYYAQILNLKPLNTSIGTLRISTTTNEIQMSVITSNERELNEYLVALFETYGVDESTGINSWIVTMPTYSMQNDTHAEVVIRYA